MAWGCDYWGLRTTKSHPHTSCIYLTFVEEKSSPPIGATHLLRVPKIDISIVSALHLRNSYPPQSTEKFTWGDWKLFGARIVIRAEAASATRPAATTRPALPAEVAAYAWAAVAVLTEVGRGVDPPAWTLASIPPDKFGPVMLGAALASLPAVTRAFDGVTTPGRDYRRLAIGSAYRVRALGGRRVRIEMWSCRLDDPIGPVLAVSEPDDDRGDAPPVGGTATSTGRQGL